jgi:hypothetical protein
MSAGNTTAKLGRYSAKPYQSDGGFSANGLLLTTAAGVAVAIAMGIVAAIVGQFFYAIFIFPVVIGAAVGAAQVWAIQHTRIRTPLACGAAGLIAGVVAVTAIHAVDYVSFLRGMDEARQEEQSLHQAIAAAEDAHERDYLKEILAEYEADPQVIEARRVQSFAGYLDWSAQQGVEITSAHGASKPLNLGRQGSYAYWGMEAVIVAIISAGMARRRAGEPFCLACDRWKTGRELGVFAAKAKAVGQVVESGNLDELLDVPAASGAETAISVYECPQCADSDEIVLQVDTVTYNNGVRNKSTTSRAVYPRRAAEDLSRFFTSGNNAPTVDGEPVAQQIASADTPRDDHVLASQR